MGAFSVKAQWVACLFMFLSGLPFMLYVQSIRRREGLIFRDAQVRGFFGRCHYQPTDDELALVSQCFALEDALLIAFFNVVSILTTTGFGLTDFGSWSNMTTILFVFLMLIGACSGSTSGGFENLSHSDCWVTVPETSSATDASSWSIPTEIQWPTGE